MNKSIVTLALILLQMNIMAQTIDYHQKAADLVLKMTIEEKASLCSGLTSWMTKPVERLNIPSIYMTDGPHGLRKSEGNDFSKTVQATCFPTASALASSWDVDLLHKVGVALGQECQANDVQIILGPGVNMKRSPLCGRNFEYFSEDPVLAGNMAAAFIQGVQSQGVGTSLKHFAANNQEFERLISNSIIDERTLNEIYLPAFEIAVKQAQPWTVMCAYNKLNGVYASENEYLLTDRLRTTWGFNGFVVSDWGAVSDRVAGIKAGLNLEMPTSNGYNDKKIVEAVKSKQLKESDLDEVVTELLAVILKAADLKKPNPSFDKQQHHQLAREVSSECIVLLKNDRHILPLNLQKPAKIAVIGSFAKAPRYQGAGSSQVKTTELSNAWDELNKLKKPGITYTYAEGYTNDGSLSDKRVAEAVQLAKQSNIVILFAGLPDSYEMEGADRKDISMPDSHNKLIEAVTKANPNTIVVLQNGSAVSMPWVAKPAAILECYLGGQAGGGAIADVLTGKVNPSGKLSETFPLRIEDNPSFLGFPGQNHETIYGEGIFIGYRYYDKKKVTPLFPFGYGLSYTTFAYTNIKTSAASINDNEILTVEVTVKNTGKVEGKEIVQLYVHDQGTEVLRPVKELKHFAKISLKPGEEKTIKFELGFRDFAFYDAAVHDWVINPGNFDILAGGSSVNLPLVKTVGVTTTRVHYPKLTRNSLLVEFSKNPIGKAFYDQIIGQLYSSMQADPNAPVDEETQKAINSMMLYIKDMPVYKFVLMSEGKLTDEMLDAVIKSVNEE